MLGGRHDPARERRQPVRAGGARRRRLLWRKWATYSPRNRPGPQDAISEADQFLIEVTRPAGRSRNVPGVDRQLHDTHFDQQCSRSLTQRRQENLPEETRTIKSLA
jgi:hypothetical protein